MNEQLELLTEPQRNAWAHVERQAIGMRPHAELRLLEILQEDSLTNSTYRDAMEHLRTRGKVALAFHPDRLTRHGHTVVDGLLSDGAYENQFVTGLSGGSTSAHMGGRRDEWERRLFGGSYHRPGADTSERPKYGALFLVAHPDGPCPRFGSCYLVLRPEVSARCSFTVLGSQEALAAEQTGTLAAFEPVLAALAEHISNSPAPLGIEGLTLERLLTEMRSALPIAPDGASSDQPERALDSFVEAQVHGPIDLRRDVEALVVDSSFRGTEVGRSLRELSSTYDIAHLWHPGFAMPADAFPEEFRGSPTRRIAERIAIEGMVNAPILGAAENDYVLKPDAWGEDGTKSEGLTGFRRVWHALVLLGSPSITGDDLLEELGRLGEDDRSETRRRAKAGQ